MGRARNNRWRRTESIGKKVLIIALGGTLLSQPVVSLLPGSWSSAIAEAADVAMATATAPTLKLTKQAYVTAGAKRMDYLWSATRNGKAITSEVHVIEIDLSNPYVSLNTMSGKNHTVGTRNSITNMTKESGAVAGINADVFVMTNEGAPMGVQITSGAFESSPSKLKGMYAFGVSKDRKPTIENYTFEGLVTAADGSTFALEGLNQSAYGPEYGGNKYSHVDTMYIYTSAWNGAERPTNTGATPTEVLVRNGIIEQISIGKPVSGQAPADGYILRTHGKAATFVKEHLQVGQAITADYSLISSSTGAKVDPASFEMLIGGHTLLVDGGAASAFSRDVTGVSGSSYTSRSGVGYSKDGTKVYLITSEKYGSSTGLSLKELQQVMVQLGVYKGVNLDGGGSTTMVERPLGTNSLTLAHSTQMGTTQRSVSNGIGVFTSAPTGTVKGVTITGSNVVFLGQKTTFALNGYDTYYNPIKVDATQAAWSANPAVGTFSSNTFTATKVGKTTISVKAGDASAQYTMEVIGQDQIASISLNTAAGMLTPGSTLTVPVTVKLKNGKTYKLSGESLKWEYIGFSGAMVGDTLTVKSVKAGVKTGYAIGRYDGFPTLIPFTQGETVKAFEDFEKTAYPISSQVTPKEIAGSVSLATDLPGQTSAKALKLTYDFTNGTGTKASYAAFNTNGVSLSGNPTSMSLDVYSDQSKNWVRAELIDADGKAHLVDVTKQLDWSGWKTIKVNLSSLGMKYPVKLKRIYVVTLDSAQAGKTTAGVVGIDNMSLNYAPEVTVDTKSKVEMIVGKTNATLNGKALKLDAAPIQLNGATYVPLRFVTDALGGQLFVDGKLNKVSVLRGTKLLEMVIGEKGYVLNGVRQQSEVAPIIRNNRTLIPVRLFSEKLGFTVGYDAKQKKITIQ
ncbi:stalk domain-containing protein [Paenibacillus sp. YIM B09110]|uniref:stalk domain-containing protein n=1 Tax=Paenibacillus sp. YIM B09110 TaxID=3126102 RepID=UPI00301E3F35